MRLLPALLLAAALCVLATAGAQDAPRQNCIDGPASNPTEPHLYWHTAESCGGGECPGDDCPKECVYVDRDNLRADPHCPETGITVPRVA